MRTTNIRFTGLASGLDTESMVQAMVQPYKYNVDQAIQEQKLLELKKDAWKEMNGKIYKFYTDTLSNLRLERSFNNKEVTMSPAGLIEIGNKGSFPDGTHKITVEKLAQGAMVDTSSIGKDIDKNKITLSSLDSNFIDKTIEIGVGGKTTSIKVDASTTIRDLEKNLQDAGLSAQFDEKAGAFFISTKETGSSQTIEFAIKDKSGNVDTDQNSLLGKLGIGGNTPTPPVNPPMPVKFSGEDAEITYNGVSVTSATNVVTVNGMEIKLLGADPSQEITVVSKADTETTKNVLLKFVNEYNNLIEEMNNKINAPYNKSYMPLTDEQKKEMSEEDIKLWNAKVEDSLLRKDPVLQAITSSMRSIISDTKVTVMENGKEVQYTLASFGITTSPDYKEGGKLIVDEKKFNDMASKHPDVLTQLFTKHEDPKELARKDWNAGGATGDFEDFWNKADQKKYTDKAMKQSGLGVRLYEDISDRLKGTTIKSSNFLFNDKELDKKIRSQKDEVAKLEDKMYRMEDMYYKQFTAMEKMLSQLNNQSNWLMSQLGGM